MEQNQAIDIEKFFEMFGRLSLQRDMLAQENERLRQEARQLKEAMAEKNE